MMLTIENLRVEFTVDSGIQRKQQLQAVRGVSLMLDQGETVAIVGESGSGKSQLFNALMGLLPTNGNAQGSVVFNQQSLLNQPDNVLNKIRGKGIGMIFQDPMTALNPYLRIGKQLTEVLEVHEGTNFNKESARRRGIEMLDRVKIKDPELRFNSYPHELSGGMRQRVVIAMALLCKPKLIIADEPTTALDVTVQTEIIRLLKDIHQQEQTSIVLITHDLPLVAGLCERIIVMYAGKIVETGSVDEIFHQAQHPYTQALLAATPTNTQSSGNMTAIEGQPPDPLNLSQGCAFSPRCAYVEERCKTQTPPEKTINSGHVYSCFKETD